MSFPRYPSYKDSGVEWLGAVPGHWAVKRLRFVAELNPSKSESGNLDRDTVVSFLPMDAIGEDGSLRLDSEKPIRELESGYTYFRDGDVTVAKITPCYENGKGALMRGLANGIGFGTTELIVARPKSGEILGPYLHYLFISPEFRNLGESHMYGAGGQKRVSDGFVRNFATAFPPTSEQAQIATFLDRETAKIDALVAEQRRLMELLKEKRQAVISHAVTKGLNPNAPMKPSGIEWLGDVPEHWQRGKLNKLISTRKGVAFKAEHFTDEGVAVVKASDIKELSIRQPTTFLPPNFVGEYSQAILDAGEIILSTVGSSPEVRNSAVGQLGLLPSNLAGSLLNQNTVVFSPRFASLTNQFLFLILQTTGYRDHLDLHAHGTANQASLNVSAMLDFEIVLPSPNEQREIAADLCKHFVNFDRLTGEAQNAINLLQERRTALISAAVTGQIDVRHLA